MKQKNEITTEKIYRFTKKDLEIINTDKLFEIFDILFFYVKDIRKEIVKRSKLDQKNVYNWD